MILLKLGGSLFSPKNKNNFVDEIYLRRFSDFFSDLFFHHHCILLHGTGNIGHGFVEKYGLSQQTYSQGKIILHDFFTTIDNHFPNFTRLDAEEIMQNSINYSDVTENILSGGDIGKDLHIISSDDLFSYYLNKFQIPVSYLLTDVDGVYDTNGNIISEITKESVHHIHFGNKQGDVTGSMNQKIKKIFDYNYSSGKIIWICNGYDLENVLGIITTGEGKGTKIIC